MGTDPEKIQKKNRESPIKTEGGVGFLNCKNFAKLLLSSPGNLLREHSKKVASNSDEN